jgi:hypothetical protein
MNAGAHLASRTSGAGYRFNSIKYRFGERAEKLEIKFVKLPPHALQVDETQFLRLLAGSISLTKEEKVKILHSVPSLSQYQLDELVRIFQEEKEKFQKLDGVHQEQLNKMEDKYLQEWEEIEFTFKKERELKAIQDLLGW